MGWIPEIFMTQELITEEDEAERKIKDDLQVSLKGKENIDLEGERQKNERNLPKKEWILLCYL